MTKNLVLVYPKHHPGSERLIGDISCALLYLAGAARPVCDNIKIFDYNAPVKAGKTTNQLIEFIKQFELENLNESTVIGINCLFSALFPQVRAIAQTIKQNFSNIKIIIGGMHPTLYATEIMQYCPEFDAVAIGESDISFPNLLKYFYGESHDDLDSVVLRDSDGQIIEYPKKGYIDNLDDLPMPGYEFFDFAEYAVDTSKWMNPDGIKISGVQMPIITSRSCPNKCSFCSMRLVMGNKIRFHSAERVFNEIKHLYDNYGINYFEIMDDNFTLNKSRAMKICQMIIDSGMKVYLRCLNGLFINSLDEELIFMLRRAGVIMANLGVESGSDYIRKTVIGKAIPEDKIRSVFELCQEVGIHTSMLLIIGFPEETEQTIQETKNFIETIESDQYKLNILKPFPGTRLFDQCKKDSLFADDIYHDTLWEGGIESNATQAFRPWEYEKVPVHVYIKPYSLSVEYIAENYQKLYEIIIAKEQKWIDHVKKTTK